MAIKMDNIRYSFFRYTNFGYNYSFNYNKKLNTKRINEKKNLSFMVRLLKHNFIIAITYAKKLFP